ncbi:hypothetical protein KUV28_05955 [Ferrimonas balearica]|nr:hypothetical protein [Ferrimonas balearica]
MYIDFYGRKTSERPSEGYFEKAKSGIWNLSSPGLPVDALMSILEDINLKVLQSLFSDPTTFWDTLATFNFDLMHAGLDPEARASRDEFNEFFKSASSDAQKIILYYSIRGYNHSAQNMLNHVLISLGDAYELLARDNLDDSVPLDVQSHGGEHYRNLSSPTCFRVWEKFGFCIEKTLSFLDFLSKYVAEISAMHGKRITGRLNTSSVTFGGWRKIKIAKDTALCDLTDELRLLTVLRDETVHNGTIDHFSRIYEHAINSKVQARFLLLPDHEGGRILTAAGRRRFYCQDNHLNAILPGAINRVLNDTLLSLRAIDTRMPTVWDDPSLYYDHHKELHEALDAAAKMGAFVKFKATDS